MLILESPLKACASDACTTHCSMPVKGYYSDRLLAMYRRILPADHPSICIVEMGMGSALAKMGRYAGAEGLLAPAWDAIARRTDAARLKKWCLEALVELYESWDTAEPGKGYAEKAAEWRAKLEDLRATEPRSDEATEGNAGPPKP